MVPEEQAAGVRRGLGVVPGRPEAHPTGVHGTGVRLRGRDADRPAPEAGGHLV